MKSRLSRLSRLWLVLPAGLLLGWYLLTEEDAATGGVNVCVEITCDDDNACTEDICDPEDPWGCVFESLTEDTPCGAGWVCDGAGACVACNDDGHCPSALRDCVKPACVEHECGGAPVADGTPCDGGTCQAGRCELSGSVLPCTELGIRNAIVAGGGPYTFDCQGATTVTTRAEIIVDNAVVLDGGGWLAVDGEDDHRVFSVAAGVVVELRGLTIQNGAATKRLDHHSCGGLANAGVLKLVSTEISDNTAESGGGGGICNSGYLQLLDSIVRGNTAKACAGIFNNGGLTLIESAVLGNSAEAGGGGICSSDTLTLRQSTVAGNTATYAGGIENGGSLTMTDSTISGNVSEGDGEAIFNVGEATLTDSNIAGSVMGEGACVVHIARAANSMSVANTVVVGCCSGRTDLILSDGHSFESPGDTCGFNHETYRTGISADELEEGGR